MSMLDPLDRQARLKERIDALGPWFHNIEIDGVQTAPGHFLGDYPNFKFRRFEHALPRDLSGKTVLDIGCNAGFYSFEMKRRGAARVLGIDGDDRYLEQARFVADERGFCDCEFEKLSVYDVGALGEKFDLIIFMGVLYHLRHPLLALDLIREHVARDLMLFQTMQRGSKDLIDVPDDHPFHTADNREPPIFDDPAYPKMHFIERQYANDWTNWWAPNRACSEAMLRASGFKIDTRAEDEVYLCRIAPVPFAEWGAPAVYPAKGKQ
jgi:tRNA (mo5U34)-methyltransferase